MSPLIVRHQKRDLHNAYILQTLKWPPRAVLCSSAQTASTKSLSELGKIGTCTSPTKRQSTPYLKSKTLEVALLRAEPYARLPPSSRQRRQSAAKS